MESAQPRNLGIDLLRIVAMMLVPLHHIMVHGGVLDAAPALSLRYETAWFLNTAAFCAVNVYVLIAGYVGIAARHRWSNLIYLTLQVVFYSVLIALMFYLFMPGTVTLSGVFREFVSLGYESYWFFTAYFALFFFMPFLNWFVKTADRAMVRRFLVAAVALFSVVPTLFQYDTFKVADGYSVWWFMVMYVLGAYIRTYDCFSSLRSVWLALLAVAGVAVSWGFRLLVETGALAPSDYLNPDFFYTYNSPTTLLTSAALLVLFARLRPVPAWQRVISFFAPVAFGVYLIHDNLLVRYQLVAGAFAWIAQYNAAVLALASVACALAIWLACSLVDRLRLKLFDALGVRRFAEKLEARLKRLAK